MNIFIIGISFNIGILLYRKIVSIYKCIRNFGYWFTFCGVVMVVI